MNILIFVMTMLLLLASMTYARLEVYRNSQIFQVLFESYMQKDERGYINLAAQREYDRTKGSKKGSKESGNKVDASPRISLSPLFKKQGKEEDPKEKERFLVLLKNLITSLYADQPFYREMQKQRPQFVDDVILALMRSVDSLPEAKRPKKAVDLANIHLGDDQLNEVYYKMLHGAPSKEIIEAQPSALLMQEPIEDNEHDDDESDAAIAEKEADEHKSPKGYYSLLDFVTLDPVKKVRIYLASPEVLEAIYFNNPDIVQEILRERRELYKEALGHDKEGIKSLSETFKNRFNNREDPLVGESILDFTVSKTDPKKYE